MRWTFLSTALLILLSAGLQSCAAQGPPPVSGQPRVSVQGAISQEAGLGVLVVGSIAAIPIALAAAPLTRHVHAPAAALALPTRTDDVTLDEAYWIAFGYHASSERVDQQTG